jgi:hypothetical protein
LHFGKFIIEVTNLKKCFQYDETERLYLKPQQNDMKTLFSPTIYIMLLFTAISLSACTSRTSNGYKSNTADSTVVSTEEQDDIPEVRQTNAILVSPENPKPGQTFRVVVTGNKNILKSKIKVNGPSGKLEATGSRNGNGLPFWRVDNFVAVAEGEYQIEWQVDDNTEKLNLSVREKSVFPQIQTVWKTNKGWDSKTEALYSAWVNALFYDADERASWKALNEVTENQEKNFLHNHLSLDEDNPSAKTKVLMEPDCADNPYYLRAYFAWKLGLPFGYHEADRGTLGRNPGTGRWITNEIALSRSHPVLKFNSFMRMVMNGVHSGSARTALTNENSDYYPIPLTREALRPGIVFADPYGHTLILVRQIPQSRDGAGVLLSVDAQPDGTVGIKRFWKGNFLFNTNKAEVIGEPGFKAFRPIVLNEGKIRLLKTDEIKSMTDMTPFSLQQKEMVIEDFYHTMERIINPKPLDPETALLDLIKALHEQLVVRVTSVANGEDYMKAHPGTVIPIPGRAPGLFQTGGLWEDFSTPNRDLRLLIAMDAVLSFPAKIVNSPEDYKLPMLKSPEAVKEEMETLLHKKASELTITYLRSNGSEQTLTMKEILARRESFEMAYNPNDGPEIRWGAPENSEERSTCRRKAPAGQQQKMLEFRIWFQKRLHPPT